MSDQSRNFGDTLSGGIQDVSALLPLLGTEQCERHVGSALEKGYLYAAAATLSLFGSLGIVKAAFVTLLATITYPFYGGRWVDNAGFTTSGSVSSMVTIDKDTGMYEAEMKLRKLLKAQGIDDFHLLSEVRWSGQKHAKDSMGAMQWFNEPVWDRGGASFSRYLGEIHWDITHKDFKELVRDLKAVMKRPAFKFQHSNNVVHEVLNSWNALLIMTSALSAVLSMTPYIYLASTHWNHPLSWIYPALRSFGSFLCVVCVQLALQTRIHQIANMCLAWMKMRQSHKTIDKEVQHGKAEKLEERIHTQLSTIAMVGTQQSAELASRDSPSIIEEGRHDDEGQHEDKGQHVGLSANEQQEIAALLYVSPKLVVYQLLIAAGMAMIVAGYVGCFSIVSQTDLPPSGPYIWFAMETMLSMLRIFLWGINPSWDEHTEWTLMFQQHNPSNVSFPLITSPDNGEELGFGGNAPAAKRPFFVYAQETFSSMAQARIGLIQPPEANGVTLYYALIIYKPFASSGDAHTDMGHKYLSVTMLPLDADLHTFTLFCRGHDEDNPEVFLSTLETLPGTGVHQVSLERRWSPKEFDRFLWSREFRNVMRHAQHLSTRLFAEPQKELHLRWDFSDSRIAQTSYQNLGVDGAPLSEHDRRYISLREQRELTAARLQNQLRMGTNELGEINVEWDKLLPLESLNIIEGALLEVLLWDRECELTEVQRQEEDFALQLLPVECMHAMQTRIAKQKDSALLRYQSYGWSLETKQFAEAWDHLLAVLQKLRKHGLDDDIDDPLIREIKEFWKSARAGDALDVIEELCSKLLPPSLHGIFTQIVEEFQKEFHYLCLLLTTFPDDPPATTNRPYVSIINTWSLKQVQDIEQISTLQFPVGKFQKRSLSEYLNLIVYPNKIGQAEKMTTLIVDEPRKISNTTREAITDHIVKNPNILCLSGMDCHRPGAPNAPNCEQLHCKAVFANRQRWKETMQGGSDFVFRVGFEARDNADIVAKGDHIRLWDTGRCLVLFHCPSAGELTVTLSVRRRYAPIELEATLQSDVDSTSIRTQTYEVPTRQTKGELERVTLLFSIVAKGTGEIAIEGNKFWKIHGLVEVQWKAMSSVEAKAGNDQSAGEDGPASSGSHTRQMSKRASSDMEEAKEQDSRNEQETQRDAVMVNDLDDQGGGVVSSGSILEKGEEHVREDYKEGSSGTALG